MALKDIRNTRITKRTRIENPYPISSGRTHPILNALADFEALSLRRERVVLVGRIRAVREHGGSTFLHFEDGTGTMQAYLKRDVLGENQYRFFLDNFDIGDFIEVSGILFVTKRGEKTIEVHNFRMLAKALLPLPEKWHGLQDIEERFRKRYLDFVMNPEARKKIEVANTLVANLRRILNEEGFLEVQTPILQPLPGGALAVPFKTHFRALNMDLYLRISPELYLKRLLVGGFEKIYEIGKCFRNEGIDWSHNPEFTMLELYWAYQERDGLMEFVERFITKLLNTQKLIYQGNQLNFATPWRRVTFREIVKEYAGIDVEYATDTQLKRKVHELGIQIGKTIDRVALLDELYKKTALRALIQPTFVLDHPVEMAILAKAKEENPKYADRFQLVVAGMEIVNGFSELNDPIEQRKRFEKSKIAPERKDEDFLEAMEYGMPPAAGLGIGIDRLAMLVTDSHRVREVIAFPTMKQKQKSKSKKYA
jgi:lysyl-tRNA synthetase class 2